ncbi:hypothetical protein FHT76_001598 [Rhizobium sp. BK176]|nr:hypothetical protein [Rhizobium sp. BK176]
MKSACLTPSIGYPGALILKAEPPWPVPDWTGHSLTVNQTL